MPRPGIQRETGERALLTAISERLFHMFDAVMASSLARNAYALMTSIVVTSALGLLFWLLAGRLFDQAAVGIGSVLINTAMTISVITRLSLNNVLQRFLPGTGPGSERLVLGALAIGAIPGALAGLIFARTAGWFIEELALLSASWALSVFFAVIVAAWAVYSLLESTLSALRAAHWVPVFSISSSALKIGALAGASLFAANALGLLAAWIIPVIPAVVVGSYLVFAKLLPKRAAKGRPLPTLGAMARFYSIDYLAGLAPTIAIAAAPLIVLDYAGPETTAQYYIGWLIAYSIYMMGHSMGISLLAESVVAGERIASLAGQAIAQAVLPITVVSIAIALLAPGLMALFGPGYQGQGTVILQLLALSCIPWTLETIFLAVARAKDWLPAMLGVQWLNLVLALSLGLFLVPEMGGAGMAMAWLLAQTASVLVILIGIISKFGLNRALNVAVVLSGGLVRIVRGMIGAPNRVTIIEDREGAAPDGEKENLGLLHSDPRLSRLRHLLPPAPRPGWHAGTERLTLADLPEQDDPSPNLATAAQAIARIHAATASLETVSATWTDSWIRRPLATIRRLERRHRTRADMALAALEAHMLEFWSSRQLHLGVAHCNLVPESFLLETGASDRPHVNTIVGWSHMRRDAPAGLDICHLALTTRMMVRDQELGPVVHDLLNGGTWSASERDWLAAGGTGGHWLQQDDLRGEMVLLAWIHHLARNLDCDAAYATNHAWRAVNLDWPLQQVKRYLAAQ